MKITNIKLLLSLFILFPLLSIAQKNEGKKIKYSTLIIGLEGKFNTPLLSGFFNDKQYVAKGDEMVEKRELINYGYQLTCLSTIKSNIAMGFQIGVTNYNTLPNKLFNKSYTRENIYSNSDTFNIKMQSVGINQIYFIPTIEFYNKNGTAPVGLHHFLGAGLGVSKIQHSSYSYSINKTNSSDEDSWSDVDYYNFKEDWPSFKNIYLQYGIGMRVPITKSLIYTINAETIVTLSFSPGEESLNLKNDLFKYQDVFYNSRRDKFIAMYIKTGLMFTL